MVPIRYGTGSRYRHWILYFVLTSRRAEREPCDWPRWQREGERNAVVARESEGLRFTVITVVQNGRDEPSVAGTLLTGPPEVLSRRRRRIELSTAAGTCTLRAAFCVLRRGHKGPATGAAQQQLTSRRNQTTRGVRFVQTCTAVLVQSVQIL